MTELEMAGNPRATRHGDRLPALTMLETGSLIVAALSLVLLYAAISGRASIGGKLTSDPAAARWMFYPHILLMALIIGGLRRSAVLLQTFTVLFALLLGLGVWIDSAFGKHSGDGISALVLCQVVLFVLVFRSAKDPFAASELPRLGPRIALGGLVAAAGWLGAGPAVMEATAPARAAVESVAAAKRQAAARRDARNVVMTIASCMQQVPVTPDSEPVFPATLAELSPGTCPEATQPPPSGFVVEYAPAGADSTGHFRTFTLTLREQPASDTSLSYSIDESMITRESRAADRGFASSASIDMLNTLAAIGRCIEGARTKPIGGGDSTYPASLLEVASQPACGLRSTRDPLTARLASGFGHAIVRYTPPAQRRAGATGGYTLRLEPARDSLGRAAVTVPLSFFSDTNGSIHVTRRARPATDADPVIPDCVLHGVRVALSRGEPCRQYLPRQRWGFASSLPTIGWSMSGTGTLGVAEMLYFIPQYQPVVPADSAVEVRVSWDANGPETTMRRRRGVAFGEPMGNGVNFRFQHAYPDTGTKIIHFQVRTGAGEEYEMRDTVRVLAASRRRE